MRVRRQGGGGSPPSQYFVYGDEQYIGHTEREADGRWTAVTLGSAANQYNGDRMGPFSRHVDATGWLVRMFQERLPESAVPAYEGLDFDVMMNRSDARMGNDQTKHDQKPLVRCSGCRELMLVGFGFRLDTANARGEVSPCCQAPMVGE